MSHPVLMVPFVRRIDVDTDAIVRLYESGLRAEAVARELGCEGSVVLARLKEAGVKVTRRAAHLVAARETVSRLYVDEQWTAQRIAREYGVSGQTVVRYLREWGVPVRRRWAGHGEQHRPCPVSLPFRAYALGFCWGDLAVEVTSTVAARGSTTHEDQVRLVRELFEPFGHVQVSRGARSMCVRASLDRSFSFLAEKYSGVIPTWIAGPEGEAAFAAGYIDAEGSFGVYDGRARFKLDSYDTEVHAWLSSWMIRSGIPCRSNVIARSGDPRPDAGSFSQDLHRINVNDSLGILRLAATLEPFLRHERRRARMSAAVSNIHERLRSRAFP